MTENRQNLYSDARFHLRSFISMPFVLFCLALQEGKHFIINPRIFLQTPNLHEMMGKNELYFLVYDSQKTLAYF